MADEWETVAPATTKAKSSSDGWETVEAPEKSKGLLDYGKDFLHETGAMLERGAIGVAKPPAAVAEALGWGAPAKQLLARDKYLKEHSGASATAGSFLGDVAGFLLPGKAIETTMKGIQAVPQVVNLASKLTAPTAAQLAGRSAVAGSGAAMLEPVGKAAGEEGYTEEKAKQAATGAVLGAALPSVVSGASRILNPKLERLQELVKSGFGTKEEILNSKITPGQMMGGAFQTGERIAQSLPLSGMKPVAEQGMAGLEHNAKIRAAQLAEEAQLPKELIPQKAALQKQAILEADRPIHAKVEADTEAAIKAAEDAIHAEHGRAYSTPIINEAIAPLGIKLPEGVHGNEAIKFATDALEGGYKGVYESMGSVPLTKSIKQEFNDFVAKRRLTPDYKMALQDEVDSLANATSKNQKLKPEDWHNIYSDLGKSIHDARISKDPGSKGYAAALQDLRDKWFDLVKGKPGSEDFLKLQQASSELQAPIKAASTLKAVAEQGGAFDPKQFLAGLKADSTQRQFARGTVNREEAAVAAHQKYVEALKAHKSEAAARREAAKEQVRLAQLARKNELADPEHAINAQARAELNALNEAQAAKQAPTSELLKQMHKEGTPGYFMNRLGFALAAQPLMVPLMHGIQHGAPMAGLAAGFSGGALPFAASIFGPGLATRALYSNPNAQRIIKRMAAVRSPEMIKAGQALQQKVQTGLPVAPTMGAVGATKTGMLPSDTGEEEMAHGGLVHLANGGAPKKSSPIVDMRPYIPLSVYRADPAGKHKSADRLETLPTKIEKDTLENFIKAMRAGEEHGVPQLTPQQIAKMALIEGRGDLGFNTMNYNNPQAHKIASTLVDYGHPDDAAGFAGALLDKQQLAQRKGIPFEHAWNGLGKSKVGQTGQQYANKYQNIDYALEHPKNAELMKTINSAYEFQTPKPNASPLESLNPMGDQAGLTYLR